MNKVRSLLVGSAALSLGLLAPVTPRQSPQVEPLKPGGIYSIGEEAGWTVTPGAAATGKVSYVVKRNNQEVVKTGEIDLASGKATIDIDAREPEMLYMLLSIDGKAGQTFGAAIAPEKLKPSLNRPNDFDAFWRSKIAQLEAVPENPVLTPGESGKPDVDYATIRMDHVNGTHVYGQIAKPSKPGKYPALLILQWASPPYRLWSPWVADRAAEGWLTLNIEPHDVLPTEPQAYYNGLPAALKSYQSINQEDRDRSYFVEMYLRDYRAVDYLTHRSDWDGKTLVVMGTSMGGQQSLAVAGLHPKVTHVIVEEPAGCDLNGFAHGRQVGYPFFPNNNPKVLETAQYVDCVNFASHIKATCLVAMGFTDTIAPPVGIWTAFNQIRGPKEAAPMVDAPHNNTATPEQQRPYTDRAKQWLQVLVRGGRIEPRSGSIRIH